MGTAILGNLILLVIFGAVFLRILAFIIGIMKNVFNYYLSFSGLGYLIMHSNIKKAKLRTNKSRRSDINYNPFNACGDIHSAYTSIDYNPATGLPMASLTQDVGGNYYDCVSPIKDYTH